MIRIKELHPHYNFIWDLKQMRDGRTGLDLDYIFNSIQSIIMDYDNNDLEEIAMDLYEDIISRLKRAKEMGIAQEIYKDSRCPTWGHGILISSEHGVEIEMGEDEVEKIHPSVFKPNWVELFEGVKKEKDEKHRLIQEKILKVKAIKQTEEYQSYLRLKEKYENI